MRSIASLFLASIFVLSLAACGDDEGSGEEAFANFQDCFDDHHDGDESLSVENAITVCVLEHPIAGALLDFDTSAECQTFVAANLDDADATAEQITAGCDEYIAQK